MPSRSAQIVDLLLQKNDLGKLDWQATELPNVYQVAFPNFGIRLGPRGDDMVVKVYDGQANLVEEFTDVTVASEIDSAYVKMKALHESARRVALGVDKALDGLISVLEGL